MQRVTRSQTKATLLAKNDDNSDSSNDDFSSDESSIFEQHVIYIPNRTPPDHSYPRFSKHKALVYIVYDFDKKSTIKFGATISGYNSRTTCESYNVGKQLCVPIKSYESLDVERNKGLCFGAERFLQDQFDKHKKQDSAGTISSRIEPSQEEQNELLKLVDEITKLSWDAVRMRVHRYVKNDGLKCNYVNCNKIQNSMRALKLHYDSKHRPSDDNYYFAVACPIGACRGTHSIQFKIDNKVVFVHPCVIKLHSKSVNCKFDIVEVSWDEYIASHRQQNIPREHFTFVKESDED